MIEQKLSELTSYIQALARARNLSTHDTEDVVNETLLRILEAETSDETLFYVAKILFSEACADYYASNLALSGIKRSAHNAARKYLQANDWSAEKAYRNQDSTSKVSLRLLQAMSYSSLLDDPPAVRDDAVELSPAIAEAMKQLSHDQRAALELYSGAYSNALSINAIAERLGLSRRQTIEALKTAQEAMREALM